jgi:phage tail-like protein
MQMNNGATRSREADKAFVVDVSDTLETPPVSFAGMLIAGVGRATNKPAGVIDLRIGPDTRALKAELAAAVASGARPLAVIGNPRSFHNTCRFIVEIDDVGHAGLQKCSELSVEVANVLYYEGGSDISNKSPSRLNFADVTLERGTTRDRDLFDRFQEVAIASISLGLTDVNYMRNLDIVQQDRDGRTLRRWSLSRAWPVTFVVGDWDNESDENVIESVTLTDDFFELVQ